MTDPTTAAAAPGWYPDASGNQRWWDGRGWTDHVAAAAVPAAAYQRPQLPAGTKVDTVWVWLVSLAWLVGIIPVFFFDIRGYMTATMTFGPDATSGLTSAVGNMLIYQVVTWLLSLALYAVTVVSAFRDYRHLQSVGTERPFHWAFAFIPYQLVYLIGRHVVLRKVTRTSGAPLWAHVAALVLLTIGLTIWMFAIVAVVMNDMISMYPPGTYS